MKNKTTICNLALPHCLESYCLCRNLFFAHFIHLLYSREYFWWFVVFVLQTVHMAPQLEAENKEYCCLWLGCKVTDGMVTLECWPCMPCIIWVINSILVPAAGINSTLCRYWAIGMGRPFFLSPYKKCFPFPLSSAVQGHYSRFRPLWTELSIDLMFFKIQATF